MMTRRFLIRTSVAGWALAGLTTVPVGTADDGPPRASSDAAPSASPFVPIPLPRTALSAQPAPSRTTGSPARVKWNQIGPPVFVPGTASTAATSPDAPAAPARIGHAPAGSESGPWSFRVPEHPGDAWFSPEETVRVSFDAPDPAVRRDAVVELLLPAGNGMAKVAARVTTTVSYRQTRNYVQLKPPEGRWIGKRPFQTAWLQLRLDGEDGPVADVQEIYFFDPELMPPGTVLPGRIRARSTEVQTPAPVAPIK